MTTPKQRYSDTLMTSSPSLGMSCSTALLRSSMSLMVLHVTTVLQLTSFNAVHTSYATAGLDVQYEPTKNQFFNEPEGLRHFRDHRWKALGEENPDLLGIFFSDHFLTSIFFKQVKAWPQQKYTQQIWIRLVEYSSSEVSGPSEVPRFVFKLIF